MLNHQEIELYNNLLRRLLASRGTDKDFGCFGLGYFVAGYNEAMWTLLGARNGDGAECKVMEKIWTKTRHANDMTERDDHGICQKLYVKNIVIRLQCLKSVVTLSKLMMIKIILLEWLRTNMERYLQKLYTIDQLWRSPFDFLFALKQWNMDKNCNLNVRPTPTSSPRHEGSIICLTIPAWNAVEPSPKGRWVGSSCRVWKRNPSKLKCEVFQYSLLYLAFQKRFVLQEKQGLLMSEVNILHPVFPVKLGAAQKFPVMIIVMFTVSDMYQLIWLSLFNKFPVSAQAVIDSASWMKIIRVCKTFCTWCIKKANYQLFGMLIMVPCIFLQAIDSSHQWFIQVEAGLGATGPTFKAIFEIIMFRTRLFNIQQASVTRSVLLAHSILKNNSIKMCRACESAKCKVLLSAFVKLMLEDLISSRYIQFYHSFVLRDISQFWYAIEIWKDSNNQR